MNEWEQKEVLSFLNDLMDTPANTGYAPIDYMMGLWLEYEFNNKRQKNIPWQELHSFATSFCKSNHLC